MVASPPAPVGRAIGGAQLRQVEGAAERPVGEQVAEEPALPLGAEQAGRPGLPEDGEGQRRARPRAGAGRAAQAR